MNFGKWIVVAFVFFSLFIGTLVTVCVRQDISLVSTDYYKEELIYQDQRLPSGLHLGGGRARDQIVLFVHVERGEGRRAGEGVAVVGETAEEHALVEVVGNRPPHPDGAELHVRARQALRHRHDVGHDVPVVDGEPAAGAPEPRHHLVGDHDDAVLVAEIADAAQVAVGQHEDAVGAGHGLEDEAGDRVRALELDLLFEIGERGLGRVPAALHAVVRIHDVHDAGDAWLGGPPARIAGQRDRTGGAAVIRAVAREDLVPARVHARDADRVLVGLGAAVGEKEHVDVARRDRGELRAQPRARLGRHERVRVREHRHLVLNRLDDPLVAVADVHAHQLAVEVEEALPFRRPEAHALRARDGNRIHRPLGGPLEDRVPLRERDHLRAGHVP